MQSLHYFTVLVCTLWSPSYHPVFVFHYAHHSFNTPTNTTPNSFSPAVLFPPSMNSSTTVTIYKNFHQNQDMPDNRQKLGLSWANENVQPILNQRGGGKTDTHNNTVVHCSTICFIYTCMHFIRLHLLIKNCSYWKPMFSSMSVILSRLHTVNPHNFEELVPLLTRLLWTRKLKLKKLICQSQQK